MPQISATDLIQDNFFFKDSEYKFELLFKKYSNKNTKFSKYIVLDPVYNRIDLEHAGFNPVDFFKDRLVHKLKTDNLSLIFNCSGEGSHILFPYFNRFIDGFIANNIPVENFYYLTGDAAEKEKNKHINIYHINILDDLVNYGYNTIVPALTKQYYFTCLNRKPRYWRSKLIYELHKTQYKNKILVSHPKINNKNDFMNHDGFDVEDDIVDFFVNNSPLQVSSSQPLLDKMPIKDIISTLPDVYSQAVFDISLETYQEGEHEYITEKTFKPILNMMPVLIWGTPGINTTALTRLGFKTYEDWFDLSFDTEINTEKRMKLLLNEINRVCNMLDNTDILQWQQKNVTVLEHNRNLILNRLPTNISEFTRLYNDLEQT